MERLTLKALNGLKKLPVALIGLSLLLGGCYAQNSTTRASLSDNKSFQKKGYNKQQPIRPLGNLAHLPKVEPKSFEFYETYSASNLKNNKINEEYFFWLTSETKKRRVRNERNGFSQEATPLINEYYLKKNNVAENKLNDQKYIAILEELGAAKAKFKSKEVAKKEDNIEDYQIKGNPYRYLKKKSVIYD